MIFSQFSNKINMAHPQARKDFAKDDTEIIDLSIMEPDLEPPYQLLEAMERNLRNKEIFRYHPTKGIPELCALLADEYKQKKIPVTAENIAVTSGARGAIISTMQAILNPNDEVIIFAPYWVGYVGEAQLMGAVPKVIKLDEEDSFFPDIEVLKKHINSRTKMIIVNNPHNPTGAIWDRDILVQIVELAREKNIFIISDEIFTAEVFEGEFTSIAELIPRLENCAVVRSFSKSLAIPGMRVGWMLAHQALIEKIALIQRCTLGGVNTLTQYAIIEAWEPLQQWFTKTLLEIDRERRDALMKALSEQHGFRTMMPAGGMSCFTNIKYYLGNEVGGEVPQNSREFCDIVFRKAGVLLSDGKSMFGIEGFVRFCFTKEPAILTEAVKKIAAILEK